MEPKKEKKKLDDLTKAKLLYSGELALFAILFLVLGILILLDILKVKDWKRYLFTWVTLFGSAWGIADFFWVLFSKKRRAKNSLLDKALLLPSATALIVLDLIALINGIPNMDESYYRIVMGSVFLYITALYLFEAIWHWFYPVPGILEAVKEEPEKTEAPLQESQPEGKDEGKPDETPTDKKD